MSNLPPAAQMEAKANREQSKLFKAHEELKRVSCVVRDSDLPGDVKLRLYNAFKQEFELIINEQTRIASFRKAAEISRGKQWVTHSDE